MGEICFQYNASTAACNVVADLRQLHPCGAEAHLDDRGDVVHLPDELWRRALVPEIALGMGGRMTACHRAENVDCAVIQTPVDRTDTEVRHG
jgi:hypothetical protein